MNRLRLVPGFAACVLLVISSCGKQVSPNQDKAGDETTQQLSLSVEKMVEKHNAVTNWKANLDNGRRSGLPFSIDLEDALKPTNGSPVVIVGYLKDLFRRAETYQICVHNDEYPHIYYLLECDNGQIEIIRKHRHYDKLVIVASIESVKKPALEATANALGDEEAEIDYGPANEFFARGRCLDLQFLTEEHHE